MDLISRLNAVNFAIVIVDYVTFYCRWLRYFVMIRSIAIQRNLNLIGGTMFIIWIIEYFGYNAGEKMHILLLLTIVIFFVKTFMGIWHHGKIRLR